jgi:ribonuclease HI
MAWERRRYRGNKVWIEMDAAGQPTLDERGLAALRYKPDDERTYTVRPDEIQPLDAPAEPVPAQAPPEAAPPPAPIPEDAIVIHTDGASSGNPGPAGLGVLLEWRGRRREIRRFLGEATNNEAELAAVLAALEAVKRPELPVRLHTDSEYVIGVLTGGHRVKANAHLVEQIQAAMRRFEDLQFVKVPAHAGVPGNERADALARAAIRSQGRG